LMLGKDVRSDPKSDIAVFQLICDDPLPAATMGDSDAMRVGDWVLAIGSPFSLEQTVSIGIISSKARPVKNLVQGQLLQTDASINPGNSGGALLDLNGDLVGINTAIATTSGQFQGVGFAIPVRRVQWIIKQLVDNGSVKRSRMGLRVIPIPQDLAIEWKIQVRSGVYVSKLLPSLPAENAGMLPGDVILEVDGQRTPTPADFQALVEQLPADRAYSVKVLRDGSVVMHQVSPVLQDD
jgi:serine protease Do